MLNLLVLPHGMTSKGLVIVAAIVNGLKLHAYHTQPKTNPNFPPENLSTILNLLSRSIPGIGRHFPAGTS